MSTTNTTNAVDNTSTQEPVALSFVSTIANLPVASAGEFAKAPARVAMKFESADVVTESAEKGGRTWIRLHFQGLSLPIFRNIKQAVADLSNYLDKDTASHLSALGFETAFNKHYRNKEVVMTASAYDVDSKYVVDENSTAYTIGINGVKHAIGDELNANSAGVRIEGFLRAMLSESENDAVYEAQIAYAREQAQLANSGAKFSIG